MKKELKSTTKQNMSMHHNTNTMNYISSPSMRLSTNIFLSKHYHYYLSLTNTEIDTKSLSLIEFINISRLLYYLDQLLRTFQFFSDFINFFSPFSLCLRKCSF